jgi:hypothetical protein
MKVTLELGDDLAAGHDEQVDIDLPAVPRIGERILWTDAVTGDDGLLYTRQREYRVRMVDWACGPTPDEPSILLRLDYLGDA